MVEHGWIPNKTHLKKYQIMIFLESGTASVLEVVEVLATSVFTQVKYTILSQPRYVRDSSTLNNSL